MKENGPQERPFTSWKEIAAYLGCDERTCLRWEKKFGLPIHRAGNRLSKSLVHAYKEELDEWLKRRRQKEPTKAESQSAIPKRSSSPRLLWVGIVAGLLLIVLALWKISGISSNKGPAARPFDFRLEQSQVVLLNRKGKELGRYDTGVNNLGDNVSFHLHFGCRKIDAEGARLLPWVTINDINRDGRDEVLFDILTTDDGPQDHLVCLDAKARVLWEYFPGREMTFGSKKYSADYAVDGVDVLEDKHSGPKKIVVLCRHKPRFPSYIATISPEGRVLGEYWNSGRFEDYVLADIDNDGNTALVVSGTNNEYHKGFLAVLDPDSLWGSAPQTGDYFCPDLKSGSELFYVLFPRTDVDKLQFAQREVIDRLDLLKAGHLIAVAWASKIAYEFNARMQVDTVFITDAFREKYQKYQDEGKIPPGPLNENALAEALSKSVVYYDGERWTTTPTRNKKNLGIYLQKESKARRPAGD